MSTKWPPPEWCVDEGNEDCYFYKTRDCDECRRCTFCGANIGPRGRQRHKAHFSRARTKGGRRWVPTCRACNQSQKTKGLIAWLEYLHKNDQETYTMIVSRIKQTTPQLSFHPGPRVRLGWKIIGFDRKKRKG